MSKISAWKYIFVSQTNAVLLFTNSIGWMIYLIIDGAPRLSALHNTHNTRSAFRVFQHSGFVSLQGN